MPPGVIGWIVEVSRNGAEELSVEWQIQSILALPGDSEHCYCSPEFKMGNDRYCLRLWPKYNSESWNPSSGWMKLSFVRIGGGQCAKYFRFRVGIKESNRIVRENKVEWWISRFGSYDWNEFCSRFALIEYESRLIVGDVLTIVFSIKDVSSGNREQNGPFLQPGYDIELFESTIQGKQKALADFGKLFTSGENSDVTIQVGSEQFKVHRVILAARSPVFSAMFSHDTAERTSSKITIEDCDPEVFKVYLEYLYTGSLSEISQQSVFGLYQVADRYLADNLKLQCLKQIGKELSNQTFCDALLLATAHGETRLLEKASTFALENIFLDSFYFRQNVLC